MNIRNILSISRNIPHKKILFIHYRRCLFLGTFASTFTYSSANHAPAKKVAVHPTPTATPSPTPPHLHQLPAQHQRQYQRYLW